MVNKATTYHLSPAEMRNKKTPSAIFIYNITEKLLYFPHYTFQIGVFRTTILYGDTIETITGNAKPGKGDR